jgi:hypothetical protein
VFVVQDRIKRDPEAYKEEFQTQVTRLCCTMVLGR